MRKGPYAPLTGQIYLVTTWPVDKTFYFFIILANNVLTSREIITIECREDVRDLTLLWLGDSMVVRWLGGG